MMYHYIYFTFPAQNEQEDCDKVLEDYDYELLKPRERISYNQVSCCLDNLDNYNDVQLPVAGVRLQIKRSVVQILHLSNINFSGL